MKMKELKMSVLCKLPEPASYFLVEVFLFPC
jgi:hypothetical protein